VGATPGQGGLSDFGVVRFHADGSDDTSFAGDGGTSFGFDVSGVDINDAPTSVLADPDGRIVVAGSLDLGNSERRFGVVRLNMDGSIDSTFGDIDDGAGGRRGTDGQFVVNTATYASRILRIAGGYYVIAGTSVFSSTDTDFAARILTPSGSPWASFVGSATFPIDEPGPGGSLYDGVTDAVLVDPTTILLVGTASGKFAATRITVGTNASNQYTTLTRDSSFVGSAIPSRPNRYVGNTSSAACESAALRSDGRIVLVGGTSSMTVSRAPIDSFDEPTGNVWTYAGLVTRLNPDGSPDSGFGIGGSYVYVAPTTGSSPSNYTGFRGVRFDGAQPVIIGSSVDNTSVVSDFDGVITRLQSDLIFADGFQTHP
ncbi:MAG: delta-60 repeat domain-containing protein, partial [Dokdonella sp.]